MEPPSKSADMCKTMHDEEEDEVLEAKHGVSEARIHCPARAAHYLGKIIKLDFKLSVSHKICHVVSFIQARSLYKHILLKHLNKSDLDFSCCLFCFRQLSNLTFRTIAKYPG